MSKRLEKVLCPVDADQVPIITKLVCLLVLEIRLRHLRVEYDVVERLHVQVFHLLAEKFDGGQRRVLECVDLAEAVQFDLIGGPKAIAITLIQINLTLVSLGILIQLYLKLFYHSPAQLDPCFFALVQLLLLLRAYEVLQVQELRIFDASVQVVEASIELDACWMEIARLAVTRNSLRLRTDRR